MADILIVEDEPSINELVKRNLKLVGHACDQAFDGREALKMMGEKEYDLIILDIMLPSLSGFAIMERMERVPVIFVTAKGNLEDKLKGLTSGAEDYIVKPFEILELIARVDIVLRRYQKTIQVYELVGARVELDSRRVFYLGKTVDMTPQEYQLLEVLVKNRNIALTREKLLELAWGYDYEGDTRTVDVHIQKLRKKLNWNEKIKTVFKLGYRLEDKG